MGYWPLGIGDLTATYVCTALSSTDRPPYLNDSLHLATSISLGIMASAPFHSVGDENLVIAYLSTLMLLFYVRSHFSPPKLPSYIGMRLTNCS